MIIRGRQHDENVKYHYAITVLRAPINVSVKWRLIRTPSPTVFHIYDDDGRCNNALIRLSGII